MYKKMISLALLFAMLMPIMAVMPASSIATSDVTSRAARYCTITAPTNGATVSGVVSITVDASGTPTIAIDGSTVATAYSYNWDTKQVSDGTHTIKANFRNARHEISVTVSNGGSTADTTAPTVSISAPSNGATVSGTTTISASASDNVGVIKVEFYVDGSLKGSDTSSPYSYSWDTTVYADGSHSIYAKAYDAAGNVGTASTISVTVSNTQTSTWELISGVSVTESLSAVGDYDMWYIQVPLNTASMYSVLTCGSADFDLYGKLGSEPTTSSYDWRGYTSGGEEVTFDLPGAGTWYIRVQSYAGSGSYELIVTLSAGTTPEPWGTGGKYAIIVGISDYASISDLSYCDEDATDWYNKLYAMGYECRVYGDGHTSNYPRHDAKAYENTVRNAMQGLAAHAQAGDTVAFITSGHGSGDGRGSSYLCMYDCSGSAGCYYDTELAADIGLFAAGVNVFVFIDHCYSGGMGPELMALSNNDYIFCSTTCTEDGYGWDDGTHKNGAWTYEFLEKTWIGYFGGNVHQTMESIQSQAASTYPHTGGDAAMVFDGNTAAYFYLG